MARPYFSVLIDTYNHELFIEEAVQSVLAQDFPAADREILVVDDGSTDKTAEILRKFEPHIRVLRKQNGGQASAFNAGIPECRGEIVAFLDGDDWWVRDKLGKVAQAFHDDSSLGFVGHGIVTAFPDRSERVETLLEGFRFQADHLPGALLFRRRCSFMGTSRMAIRKSLLDRIGIVPEEIHVQADEFLFTLAAIAMPVRILQEALAYYRLHGDNGFIITDGNVEKLRRKQKSLQALSNALTERLGKMDLDEKTRQALLAYTRACADQLRLRLYGGWSWETMVTERTLYQIDYPNASVSHKIFKNVVLVSSLFVPPKRFYRARTHAAKKGLYQWIRGKFIPTPEMQHIHKDLNN